LGSNDISVLRLPLDLDSYATGRHKGET